ncbi:protein At-4/1 [Vitis vinifera]|uniref:Protein At-4/1 n=1 Tax=Vitis vinifera TaxID=29760 RepID=D7SQH8_VITVI|eukprot:XP_010656898.1 PREDICTED: protein At-4/1 isoform X2 [Vitis vinifera]
MAATSDEEMESLLSTFDQIYKDFQNGVVEVQLLRSNCNVEIEKRQALQSTCDSLKQDNERLRKLYTESLYKLAEQLERRTKCQSLKEELKRVNDEHLSKEDEHRKAIEMLQQNHAIKVGDLENQIRCLLLQIAANEATINHLHKDSAAHKTHIQALMNRLEQVQFDVESKYRQEIQDLKDCLMVEQEERNVLTKKLQNLEKELLISRTKLVEQQRDLASNRHVDTLKQKIMKLRKENEVLKRKVHDAKEG